MASSSLHQQANKLSPCIQVCALGDDGTCLGCKRTMEQIENWWTYDAETRRATMARLKTLGDDLPRVA